MRPPSIGNRSIIFQVVHLAVVRPYADTYFTSVLSGEISMKLATNIHHESGHYGKYFRGQRSKVKVVMAEAYIQMVWCRG